MDKKIKKSINIIKNNLTNHKHIILLIGAPFLLLALITTLIITTNQKHPNLNKDLLSLNQNIAKEIESGKTPGLEEMLKKRMDILKSEFIKNPNLIDSYALIDKIKNKIPGELTPFVEQNKKIEGEVRAVDAMLEDGQSYINYSLAYTDNDSNQKTAELYLKDKESGLLSSEKAQVEGLQLDNYILTSNSQIADRVTPQETEVSKNDTTIKEDRVLIIAALFKDKEYDSSNYSENVKNMFFGKGGIADTFKSESFGKYTLKEVGAVDVTIDGSYQESCTDNWTSWASQARNRASDMGYDASKYDKSVVQIIGQSEVCKLIQNGKERTASAYGTLNGSDTTYFGDNSQAVYVHEIGHNLGLHHASSDYKCDETSNNCSWNEYGDPMSIMGQGHSFSGVDRDKLGWFDDANIIYLDSEKGGEYTLHKLNETNTKNPSNKFLLKFLCGARKVDKKNYTLLSWHLDYCYYQYEGNGMFSKRHTDTIKHFGYTFLDDLDKQNEYTYLSDPEKDLYISGMTKAEIISSDSNKITFKMDKIQSQIDKIKDITLNVYNGDKLTTAAGVAYDFNSQTYARFSDNYGYSGNVGGLSYKWTGAGVNGIFKETKAGIYHVKASLNGKESKTVEVEVVPTYHDNTKMSSSNGLGIIVGQETTITANAADKYGNNIAGTTYEWVDLGELKANSVDEGSSVSFIPNKAGSYTFTAVSDRGGAKTTGTIVINVKPAPIENITLEPSLDQKLKINEAIQLQAYPRDKFGNTVKDAKLTWTGTDTAGKFISKTPGIYQVSVSSDNGIVSKTINITVPPDELNHITISPSTVQSIKVGESIKFTAQGQDKYNNIIPDIKYDWIGADSNGVYTPKEGGVFTIIASSGSINSVSVTVIVKSETKVNVKVDEKVEILGNPSLITLEKNGEASDIPAIDSAVEIVTTDKIKLSGSAADKSSVTLFVNETPYETKISSDGKWNIELDASKFKVGTYNITAQAKKDSVKSDTVKMLDVTIANKNADDEDSSGSGSSRGTEKPTKITETPKTKENSFDLFKDPLFITISSIVLLITVTGFTFVIMRNYFRNRN